MNAARPQLPRDTTARDYISKAELSRRSGLSAATIDRLCRRGLLPYWQPGGKRCRVLFPVSVLNTLSTPPAAALKAAGPASSPAAKLPGPSPRWLQPPPYQP